MLSQTDFQSQTLALCQTCIDGCKAVGATLYFRVTKGETGFRRAAEVGRSAEETGPGLVRDLLQQAWDTGQPAESQYAGRWILAIPVGKGRQGMGVLLATWEGTLRPDAHQRRLLDSVTTLASLIGPRFQEEGALAKAQQVWPDTATYNGIAPLGLSPLARGNHDRGVAAVASTGPIPARAGEPVRGGI